MGVGFIVRDGDGTRARGSASQIHLSQAADRGPTRLPFFSFPSPFFVLRYAVTTTEGTKQESVFIALHEISLVPGSKHKSVVWEFRAGPSFGSGSPEVAGRETFYMALA